ncbi:MAG: aspartate kinase [Deltaproteobacteria bacterium DG_8]|nr:MAG: aspartate kinase [Deltaproteobacteria bacterium DG_8]
MALVVQKYGGTSVATLDKIRDVAKKVVETKETGNDLVVVVSAMAGETDRLIDLAHQIADKPDEREYDVMVSTGEQVSIALLSMAIQALGYRAVSFLGFQIKIITDSEFTQARILNIDSEKIAKELESDGIIVIAGFQGIDEQGNVTTLGRGGSDTTAVAIAAALKADVCEIYTDVEGVYTTDPSICSNARKLDKISYDEMLEMASLGAKVLHTRSVEFAKKYNVPIHVRSTFSQSLGTWVVKEDETMEKVIVSGVTYNKDEAKITIVKVPDRPGIASMIFKPLAEANINVDMIIQNVSEDGFTDVTFTVSEPSAKKALEIIKGVVKEIGASDVQHDKNIVKVSIVGVGMRSHAGVAAEMFSALANEGINIMMISTSEIKISCVISAKYAELAVRTLHDTFKLGEDAVSEE